MNTASKLSAYGAALVLLVAGSWATGSAVGPLITPAASDAASPVGHGGAHVVDQPGGLASSAGGLTLRPAPFASGVFSFTISGFDGAPVTAFDVEHDRRMHLIVVRRDATGFQHLHPSMAVDGTWSVPLDLPAAGSYRAFADFTPTGGSAVTLGVDLAVPGSFEPVTHAPSRTFSVDGYTVSLAGELVAGSAKPVTLSVSRDGVAVTDLQPYLGAYGHLVALRGGDLAYLHVHPDGVPGDGVTPAGPAIQFVASVPSGGDYRLFLDFRHGGVVRTAEFTVSAGDVPAGGDVHGVDGHGH